VPSSREDGARLVSVGHQGEIEIADDSGRIRQRFTVPYGAHLFVTDGKTVDGEDTLFEWDIYNKPVVTEKSGAVRYVDVKEKVTVRDEVDDTTGLKLLVIMEDRNKELQPAIDIMSESGQKLAHYPLPTGSRLEVRDGQTVSAGDVLVKIRRETSKTRDITGGLPRVAELFEARRSKDAAIVAEIDGAVEFGGVSRGMRKVFVRGDGDARVPDPQTSTCVQRGVVRAGTVTEGPINPHDILKIKGIEEVQEYLVNEIQEVYRLQGVRIDDKHIETIVRQMLKVRGPGDTLS
jgi:DNA-directed RNA polymerase subunit beta'